MFLLANLPNFKREQLYMRLINNRQKFGDLQTCPKVPKDKHVADRITLRISLFRGRL